MKWDRSVMRINSGAICDNIRSSIRRQLPQFMPHPDTPQHVCLVGGGWSLEDTFDELMALHHAGMPIVALNGAANWLMERNVRPSMFMMLDARDTPENRAFVEKPIPRCRYFLASQCAPAIFDACEGRDVTLYHSYVDEKAEETAVLDAFYAKRWQRVPAAGFVGMVACLALRLLGFRFQHWFGIDSCHAADGRHHAYPQSQNDEGTALFTVAGRAFRCSAAMASQATTFRDIIAAHGKNLMLDIHGDGVLAHMIRTGAEMKEAA